MSRTAWIMALLGAAYLIAMEVSDSLMAAVGHGVAVLVESTGSVGAYPGISVVLLGAAAGTALFVFIRNRGGLSLRAIRGFSPRRAIARAREARWRLDPMPLLALVSAALVVGFEQLVQWRYGPAGIIGVLCVAIGAKSRIFDRRSPSPQASRRTTALAVTIAGSRRAHLRDEWQAILAGVDDPDAGLTSSQRHRLARGFLIAALRMRLRDLLGWLWAPADWVIASPSRSNGLVATGVGAQILYIQHTDGLHVLLTEGWGWCAGCGIALRLLLSWLRRVRGIELAAASSHSEEQ